jgi:hypothetical protein
MPRSSPADDYTFAAVRVRRLWTAVCALTIALGLAACGHKQAHPTVADANNDGGYVDAGPVTYQLEISRVLNQYATEDSQYVKGLPAGTAPPTATQEWYGVFLWAKNQTSKPQTTTNNFVVVDTQGNRYYPLKLNPDINPYAWSSRTLQPLQTQPGPDTTASFGPTQGQLLLFKIGTSAFANRPLTLDILGPEGTKTLATISLDL